MCHERAERKREKAPPIPFLTCDAKWIAGAAGLDQMAFNFLSGAKCCATTSAMDAFDASLAGE